VIEYHANAATFVPQENGTTAQTLALSLSPGWIAGNPERAAHDSFDETDKVALENEEPA
jgi:hypothetical protein